MYLPKNWAEESIFSPQNDERPENEVFFKQGDGKLLPEEWDQALQ